MYSLIQDSQFNFYLIVSHFFSFLPSFQNNIKEDIIAFTFKEVVNSCSFLHYLCKKKSASPFYREIQNIFLSQTNLPWKPVLRIRIRKILASWIRICKNIRIHGSGFKGYNINQKLQKKTYLLLKPKSELLKKRDYKNFLISEWFIKF